MSTPRVSIIIPFFNAGEFLAEALASIFAQTYRDWELLLVNDGSIDESVDTAKNFAQHQPERVFLIAHEDGRNHGLPATRNLAFRHSRGEFIALLDADDSWLPNKLQQQVSILCKNPEAGMVFGRSEYWSSWNPSGREDDTIPRLVPGDRLYEPPELWKQCYPFGGFGAPCPSDLLIRRLVIEQVGGFEECFDRRYPTHEDIAFLSKVFLSVPVYVSDQCWDRYRRHDKSLWAVAQRDGGDERSRAFYFQWMGEYLRTKGVTDEKVWDLYRDRSWRYRHTALSACAKQVRSALRPIRQLISGKG